MLYASILFALAVASSVFSAAVPSRQEVSREKVLWICLTEALPFRPPSISALQMERLGWKFVATPSERLTMNMMVISMYFDEVGQSDLRRERKYQ